MKKISTLILGSAIILLGSCKKDSPTVEPTLDCNGVENGTSMEDDCGVCQQAYIYDVESHAVTLLDDTTGVVLAGPTEMLIMPNDPMNPYWNAGCITTPDTYYFEAMGLMGPANTVSYGGQTTRLLMAKQFE